MQQMNASIARSRAVSCFRFTPGAQQFDQSAVNSIRPGFTRGEMSPRWAERLRNGEADLRRCR
jgi:hypothetical protein